MQGSGKLYSALQLLKDNDNKCFIICSYFRLVQKCNLCPPFPDHLYRICSLSLQLQENRINIIYLCKKKKKRILQTSFCNYSSTLSCLYEKGNKGKRQSTCVLSYFITKRQCVYHLYIMLFFPYNITLFTVVSMYLQQDTFQAF